MSGGYSRSFSTSTAFGRQGASGSFGASASNAYASQQAASRGSFGQQASRQSYQSQQRGASQQRYSSQQQQGGASNYNSQVEQQVIAAKQPLQVNAREQVQAGQFRGTYLNKQEVDQFRGPIPIDQYKINEDPNPEVIKKRLDKVRYTQEVSVRYLNPPPAPKPGNIIIRERQQTHGPAPPLVIRQEGNGAQTPAPLVLRERPPQTPARIPEQVVEVDARPIPPPARRVVYEKLSNLPAKPQNVTIEKWLPYKPQKRTVVFEKACGRQQENPRNLIIEWEAPEVEINKVCKELCTVDADPEEYRRRYGNELKDASELPGCDDNKCGGASRQQQSAANALPELDGDVQALARVDLERYGLGEYRSQIGGH